MIMGDVNVADGRSADYEKAARQLSALVAGLGLDMQTGSYLVSLIKETVETAERDAFVLGASYAARGEGDDEEL